MDNTYLTIEGLSFKKRVIKTIAYYTELNKFKDIKLKAIERMKNKESKNEADSRTNFQPRWNTGADIKNADKFLEDFTDL